MTNPMRASLIKGGIWLTVSRILFNLLGLVSTIVLARLLLPEDFGIVANAWTILAILTTLLDAPVGAALIQIREPTRDHIDTAWTLGAIRGGVIALCVGLLAWPLALFFNEPALFGVIIALGSSVFISCLSSPLRSMLQRRLAFHLEFWIEVGSKLATVCTSILIAWIYQSYWALVWGAVAGQVVAVVISYAIAPYRPRFSLSRFRELWSFSFWLTLSQTVGTINWRFDQILIARLLGRSDLGIYSVGDNLAQMPTRETTNPLSKVLFPGFSVLGDDRPRLQAAYSRAQGILTLLVLPLGVGLALVAEPAVLLAMGPQWAEIIFVIQVLACVYGLQTISSLAQPLALSQGAAKMMFRREMTLFSVRFPIILTGLILGGLKGVVLARLVTGAIFIGFNMFIVRRLVGLTLRAQLAANLRPLLAATIMAGLVVLAQTAFDLPAGMTGLALDLALSLIVGAAGYASALGLLWALSGFGPGPEREVLALARAAWLRRKRR